MEKLTYSMTIPIPQLPPLRLRTALNTLRGAISRWYVWVSTWGRSVGPVVDERAGPELAFFRWCIGVIVSGIRGYSSMMPDV